MRAHADGDRDAFAELFRRHRDRLWAVALRTLGDPEDAADALQEALISALRAAGQFRGDAAVSSWLHRIVVNSCIDRVRRRQARPTVPLADTDPPRRAASTRTPPWTSGPPWPPCPSEQRTALMLVDMAGYPVAEVAARLGVAEGTVKSRCARGRARLAQRLGYLRNPDSPGDVPLQSTEQGGRR